MSPDEFDYHIAFCRNIGWLTQSEQQYLRTKTVAIAGLGGVGGVYLLTLVRLGLEKFHIADMDVFELQNFNRQIGANLTSVHQAKVSILEKMAREINPNIEIKVFPNGIADDNIDEFLSNVDLYVDGLDFFILNLRAQVFKRADELHIPAITAGPLGIGTSYLIFMPGQMTFEQYFRFAHAKLENLPVRFLIGLNPTFANRHYLVEPSAVNLQLQKGPSTIMACQLCAGVVGAEAVKILLNRGPIYAAPHYHSFDAYLCKHKIGWLPGGNRNPIQLLKLFLMKKKLRQYSTATAQMTIKEDASVIEKILDLARWAPSGDNNQPWRFEVIADDRVIVHVVGEAESNPYDYNGIPTQLSCGFLVETIRIAASLYSLTVKYQYTLQPNNRYRIDIQFTPSNVKNIDPLAYCIIQRSVDRRCYQLTSLTAQAKAHLAAAVGNEFIILWFDSYRDRLAIANITMLATKIRMSMPELFPIHEQVFATQGHYAETGIPLKATGMNTISRCIMRWAIKSWSRMNIMNKLGAIKSTQVELDLLPGIFCGAHFMLVANSSAEDSYLQAGAAMQRFWLMATKLGLVMQPNLTPLMLSYYADNKISFAKQTKLNKIAEKIAAKVHLLDQGKKIFFLGRIGYPRRPKMLARSIRKPLTTLLLNEQSNNADS